MKNQASVRTNKNMEIWGEGVEGVEEKIRFLK